MNQKCKIILGKTWKSDKYKESNREKKANVQNQYNKWSKVIKSDNYGYCKIGRAITIYREQKRKVQYFCYIWFIYKGMGVSFHFVVFDKITTKL